MEPGPQICTHTLPAEAFPHFIHRIKVIADSSSGADGSAGLISSRKSVANLESVDKGFGGVGAPRGTLAYRRAPDSDRRIKRDPALRAAVHSPGPRFPPSPRVIMSSSLVWAVVNKQNTS